MINLATVGYTVETRGLAQGSRALDDFGRKNVEAANSTKPVEAGLRSVAAAAGDTGAAVDRASGRVRDARGRFVAMGTATQEYKSKAEEAAKASDKLGDSLNETGTAAEKAGRETDRAGRKSRESAKDFDKMDASVEKLMNRVKGLMVTLSAYFGLAAIAQAADQWSDLQSVVGAAVQDMEAAPALMGRIAEMARSSYSPLEQTAMAFAGNVGALRDLGRGTDDAMRYTEALNNALVVTATRGERAAAVNAALGKAMDVGKLQAEGLETVLVSGGRVARALADELGTTVSGLRQMAADGKITGDVIANALITNLEDLKAEAAAMPATMADGMTLIKNSFTQLVGTFDQVTGASGTVAEGLIWVADNMQLVVSMATAAAIVVTTMYIPAFIAANKATLVWAAGLVTLRNALIATGVGALIVAAGVLINIFLTLVQRTGSVGDAFTALGELAALVWQAIIDSAAAIPDGLDAAWNMVKADFYSLLADLQAAWFKFLLKMGNVASSIGMEGAADKLFQAAEQAGQSWDELFEKQGAASAAAAESSAKAAAIIGDAFAPVAAKWQELKDISDEAANSAADAGNEVTTAATGAGNAAEEAGAKGKKASEAAAKAAHEWASALEKELTSAIDSSSKAFGDWIMRGFSDFKGFVNSILDSFKQMLSNMIALAARNRIMISLGMDPLSKAMSAAGVPGMGGGAGGWLASGIGSFANPAAGGVLGGLGGVGAGIGAGWASGGLGGALSGGIGASLSGISAGLSAGGIAGIGAAIGAAIPILAGVAAVFAIGKKMFGRKLKDTGIEATFELAEGLAAQTYKFYKGGWFRSDKTKRSDLDASVANPIEKAFSAVGNSVKGFADQLGLESERIDTMSFSFKFSTKGMSEEDISNRFQEEMARYGDQAAELVAGGMLKRFAREGETSVQTLERLATHLTTFNKTMETLGLRTREVGLQGAAAASNFIELMGGLEAFNSAMSFYYENFYSLAERYAIAQTSLQDVFDENGITRNLPRTEAEFRALIEHLDRMGRTEAVAALLGIAPAFLDMIRMAEELAAVDLPDPRIAQERYDLESRLMELNGQTYRLRQRELRTLDESNRALQQQIWHQEHLNAVRDQAEGLERQLLELQGNTAELRRLELESLYPANRELQRRIWQLQREQEVSSEREGLERRLLEAQGNTFALRQLELAALAPANRALQRQIWAAERAAVVAEERTNLELTLLEVQGNTAELRRRELLELDATNRALQERIWAEERAREIAEERQGLERQVLEALGDTAAIRRLELAALDPSNRALQERIWAIEAEAEAARAAEAIQDERRGLETKLNEVLGNTNWLRAQELRGLDASNRALQQRIWAITDAQEALSLAQDAARTAAEAERTRIDEMRQASADIRALGRQTIESATRTSEAQRMSAERQLRLAIETGRVWDSSLMTMAERVSAVDSSQFSSYTDFLVASSRAASLLSSVADKQEQEAISAEQRLEEALERYGLKEEVVQSLDDALRGLDAAIRQLAEAERGLTRENQVAPRFAQEGTPTQGPAMTNGQPLGVQVEQSQLIRELRDEVRQLRSDTNQGNAQIAKNTKASADTQRKWDIDGMPNIRELIA